jgi:hypothetical protein
MNDGCNQNRPANARHLSDDAVLVRNGPRRAEFDAINGRATQVALGVYCRLFGHEFRSADYVRRHQIPVVC